MIGLNTVFSNAITALAPSFFNMSHNSNSNKYIPDATSLVENSSNILYP